MNQPVIVARPLREAGGESSEGMSHELLRLLGRVWSTRALERQEILRTWGLRVPWASVLARSHMRSEALSTPHPPLVCRGALPQASRAIYRCDGLARGIEVMKIVWGLRFKR